MLPDASVCIDSMLGKCVAGVSVVLAISLSSCSFLLTVDEVIKTNRKCHRLDRVTTLPLMRHIGKQWKPGPFSSLS